MKNLVFFLGIGFMLSLFTSCNLDDDGYSLNDAWVGYGLVQEDAGTKITKIVMDDNEVLFPVTSDYWWGQLDNNDRILVNFTILGNVPNDNHDEQYYVRINNLRKILYKGILDIKPEIEDSIGNDPIKVKDRWIKKNLLNFELQYRGGNKIHFLNLVKQPGAITSANEPIVLELRHNNKEDNGNLSLAAVVTFDMSSLKIPGKTSTKFKVIAKGFDGEDFEYLGEYKY